jgi:hypothetical protein
MPLKPDKQLIIVFVHGWSVSNLNTYGELPLCVRDEAKKEGIDIVLREIFLSRYISFHDEVRIGDISLAFNSAVKEQLADVLKKGRRFICITHSTGGPVIRDWFNTYYEDESAKCPMSHLIMLAPANHGSALAQLGKGRVGRLKSWFAGKEPGQGVLDWLELGSQEAWQLNRKWIFDGEKQITEEGLFPFVLTGQSIDRKFYDALNTYTGEIGSDGVVRVAAANLHSRYIKLTQPKPKKNSKGELITDDFIIEEYREAPLTPLRIISGKSHSGPDMGIMMSVKKNSSKNREIVKAILECIRVQSKDDYISLRQKFETETKSVQEREQVEIEKRILLSDRVFIHDRFSMVIIKVHDTANQPVNDFDLMFTAEKNSDPNHLPQGFAPDRQRNHIHPNTITYYFNYDIIKGMKSVKDPKSKKVYRKKMQGIELFGLIVNPRPEKGFVHYIPCKIDAKNELLEKALIPNGTTLIDIYIQRIVDKEVFRLEQIINDTMPELDFRDKEPTGQIVE